MASALYDFRFALRALRRRPGFALVAILTLSLGIGATGAVFTVVDTILLRPLPFAEPERLVALWGRSAESGEGRWFSSYPDYADLRDQSDSFDGLAAWSRPAANLTGPEGEPMRVATATVSYELLPLLGIEPSRGRGFTGDEDRPGGPAVAMLGDRLWRQRFAAAEDVVGRAIRIDGVPHVVVGVLPPHAFPTDAELWLPLGQQEAIDVRGVHSLQVIGRLSPGVTVEQANAEVVNLAAGLAERYPDSNADRGAWLEPFQAATARVVRRELWLLFAAVILVFAIAATNVANLQIGRALGRRREIATRRALGAGHWQLARQLLAEGLVLALGGAAAGLILALAGLRAILAFGPQDLSRFGTIAIDARVLGFIVLIAVVSGVAFGLAPLWPIGRSALAGALRAGGGTRGVAGGRLRRTLVVGEVALAVLLVAGASLLLRSLWQLAAVDPGFRSDGVLAVDLELPTPFVDPQWPRTVAFFEQLTSELERLPNVHAATAAYNHPLAPGWTSSFVLTDREPPPPGLAPEANLRPVLPGYFRALGIPLLMGRALEPRDHAGATGAVVVNQAFVRTHFPRSSPLGAEFQKNNWWQDPPSTFEIVGVVGDVRFAGVDVPAEPAIYYPHAQWPVNSMTVLVVADGEPMALIDEVRAAVRRLDPDLPLTEISSLEARLGATLAPRRSLLFLLGTFAGVALALAGIGLYGVLAMSVEQRRRELGVRVALGARAADVIRLVLVQGLGLTAVGLVLGLTGAIFAGRLLEAMLFDTRPFDPAVLAVVASTLLLAAFAAILVPARRAIRVDPAEILRQE